MVGRLFQVTTDRPPRRTTPAAVRRAVVDRQDGFCKCGCGQRVHWWHKTNTHFDHEPALRLREINADGTDYIPPQHDPDYIDARCPESHAAKTHGTGATTAGTDIGKIKKERKRARAPQPKRPIPSQTFRKGKRKIPTRKMRTR